MSENSRNFVPGITLFPNATSQVSSQGDMDVDSVSTKINYHNGTSSSHVVTEIHPSQGASRLQNKDLDASSSRLVDPSDNTKLATFSLSGATTGTSTQLVFAQTANRVIQFPDGSGTLLLAGSGGVVSNALLDDTSVWFVDHTDITKALKFNVGGAATATSTTIQAAQTANRVWVIPDSSDTFVGNTTSATLSNKILTAPILNNATANLITGEAGENLALAAPATFTVQATSPLEASSTLQFDETIDSTTTGTATTLNTFSTVYVVVTNGGLVSLSGIPQGSQGQYLILTNSTGNAINVNNEDSSITANNRIRIGSSNAFVILNQDATMIFAYDTNSDRWRLAGGSVSSGGGGGGGSGSGPIQINLLDAVDTTLPSTTGTLIDGQTITNGLLVLFTNLVSGNNEVYKASVSGSSVTWAAQPVFATSVTPFQGAQVYIMAGNVFFNQIALYNGSSWSINNPFRMYNGAGYIQDQYIHSTTLTNNQAVPTSLGTAFQFNPVNSPGYIMDYYIADGSTPAIIRIGRVTITCASDGSKIEVTDEFTQIVDIGVTLSGFFGSGTAFLLYSTTNTTARTMRARITSFLA